MISRNFIRSSLIYTLAGTLPVASGILLLPLYNLYLGVEVFGAASIFLTFSLLVQILVTYSFDLSVYVSYQHYKNNPKGYGVLVSSSFVSIALLGTAALVVFLFFGDWIFSKVYSNAALQFWPFGLISIVAAIFQAFFRVYTGILQIRQQPAAFFWSNLFSFSLVAVMTVIGLELYPNTLAGPIGGRMIALVVSGSWALVYIVRQFGFHFDFKVLRTTLGFNNGQYIYQVQQWLINNYDRILIASWLTLADVGVYDFAFKCLMVIDFVMSGFNSTILPKVLSIMGDQETPKSTPEINRYYHGLVAVNMILVSAAIAFSPYLLQLSFIKPGYREALMYVPMLSLVFLIKGVRYYFSFPYGALRYSKPLPVIYLIISVVKIGLMVKLIPAYGVPAVIVSAVVSGILELFLLWLFMKAKFQFSFNKFKILFAPMLLGCVIVLTEVMHWHGFVVSLAFVVLCGGVLWWVYRRELHLMKLKI